MNRLLLMLLALLIVVGGCPPVGQSPVASAQESSSAPSSSSPVPLPRAHAHNDYLHKRPLFEALEQGFASVEADVFLRGEELLVAHTVFELRQERTLKSLYLNPLKEWIRNHNGQIDANGSRLWLLIDIKSDAEATYRVIHQQLEEYADMVSTVREGEFTARPVTVVISGNRPVEFMRQQPFRLAGIDGRPEDLDSSDPDHLIPWISTDWKSHFKWRGVGPFPAEEQDRLREFVSRCERRGRKLRFWGAPDKPMVWRTLWESKVSLLGTDDLEGLARFQREQMQGNP
jgi:hypothetical protein